MSDAGSTGDLNPSIMQSNLTIFDPNSDTNQQDRFEIRDRLGFEERFGHRDRFNFQEEVTSPQEEPIDDYEEPEVTGPAFVMPPIQEEEIVVTTPDTPPIEPPQEEVIVVTPKPTPEPEPIPGPGPTPIQPPAPLPVVPTPDPGPGIQVRPSPFPGLSEVTLPPSYGGNTITIPSDSVMDLLEEYTGRTVAEGGASITVEDKNGDLVTLDLTNPDPVAQGRVPDEEGFVLNPFEFGPSK